MDITKAVEFLKIQIPDLATYAIFSQKFHQNNSVLILRTKRSAVSYFHSYLIQTDKRKLMIPFIFLVWATFIISSSAQNLITNGGFEDNQCFQSIPGVGNSYCEIYPIQYPNAITNWTFNGSLSLHHNDPLHMMSKEGEWHVDLNGDADSQGGSLMQSFPTVPGAAYSVTFWFAGHVFSPGECYSDSL